jgi:hypothetical protein
MANPRFAHNVFQTAKPQEMRDWCCTVLDAHVVYQDKTLASHVRPQPATSGNKRPARRCFWPENAMLMEV